jgi:hypothetical protein
MVFVPENKTEYIGTKFDTPVNTYVVADATTGKILASQDFSSSCVSNDIGIYGCVKFCAYILCFIFRNKNHFWISVYDAACMWVVEQGAKPLVTGLTPVVSTTDT